MVLLIAGRRIISGSAQNRATSCSVSLLRWH
jgi:hypothetical protein